MKINRRPINKRGNRNALCPFYRDCLDEAVAKSWQYWDCRECQHKLSRDPEFDVLNAVNDSMPYYELPENLLGDYG